MIPPYPSQQYLLDSSITGVSVSAAGGGEGESMDRHRLREPLAAARQRGGVAARAALGGPSQPAGVPIACAPAATAGCKLCPHSVRGTAQALSSTAES